MTPPSDYLADAMNAILEKVKRQDRCPHLGAKVWNVDSHSGENGRVGRNLSLRCDDCWMVLDVKREEWI